MIKILTKFIKLTFKLKPSFYIYTVISSIVQSAKMLLGVYAIKWMIDVLMTGNLEKSIQVALFIVGIQTLLYFIGKVLDQIRRVKNEDLRLALDRYTVSTIMRFEYSYLEDPYYLDLRERAKFAVQNQSVASQLLFYISQFITSAISIVSLGTLLYLFNYWLIVSLAIAFVLHMLIIHRSNSYQILLTNQIIPINRKFGYYLQTLLDVENARDYRFTNMNKLIHDKTTKFQKDVMVSLKNIQIGLTKYSFLSDIVNYIQIGFTYIFVAIKAMNGLIPLSDFILYTSATIQLSRELTSTIGNVADLKRSTEWIRPLFELLDIPLQTSDSDATATLDVVKTIEFKHVSFKYPKSDTLVLKDLSFKINQGEKISIVGLNGAGKTTLVKLISRLYKPTEGQILINDVDIWSYRYNDYIKQIAAVFQDFKIFNYSLLENITTSGDIKGAQDAVSKVSLSQKIASLPNGLYSNYSKSLYKDGIELSGGEKQKLAISRALYKDSSLIILDEPTASLDPIAEAEIFEHFNDLVKDKTAIYISHRMSSSTFCDKVLVIEAGQMKDFTSHEQLMLNKESLYYNLFTTQAKNYL